MKPLTKKDILKRHQKNPKDKELQKDIEIKEIKRSNFNKQSLILTLFELN